MIGVILAAAVAVAVPNGFVGKWCDDSVTAYTIISENGSITEFLNGDKMETGLRCVPSKTIAKDPNTLNVACFLTGKDAKFGDNSPKHITSKYVLRGDKLSEFIGSRYGFSDDPDENFHRCGN
jgi:hypothetical protein